MNDGGLYLQERRYGCECNNQNQIERKCREATLDIQRAQRDMLGNREDNNETDERAEPVLSKGGGNREEQGKDIGKNRVDFDGFVLYKGRGGCDVGIPLGGVAEPKRESNDAKTAEDGPHTDEEISKPCPKVFAIVAVLHVSKRTCGIIGREEKLHFGDLMPKKQTHQRVSQFVNRCADDGGEVDDRGGAVSHQLQKRLFRQKCSQTAGDQYAQRQQTKLTDIQSKCKQQIAHTHLQAFSVYIIRWIPVFVKGVFDNERGE